MYSHGGADRPAQSWQGYTRLVSDTCLSTTECGRLYMDGQLRLQLWSERHNYHQSVSAMVRARFHKQWKKKKAGTWICFKFVMNWSNLCRVSCSYKQAATRRRIAAALHTKYFSLSAWVHLASWNKKQYWSSFPTIPLWTSAKAK